MNWTMQHVLAAWLALSVLAAGSWDVYALAARTPRETVSYVMSGWFYHSPALALLLGVLLGHLFLPLTLSGQGVPPPGSQPQERHQP